MVSGGIPVNDACVDEFNKLKAGGGPQYVIFKIVNNEVVEHKVGAAKATYEDFLGEITADSALYAAFDFEWKQDDGSDRSKILFISYIPDAGKVREKMTYAATKETIKSKIDGGLIEIQATDAEGISYDSVLAKAKSHTH